MAKLLTTIIASAAMAATTLVPVTQSYAHDRNFGHYHNTGGGGWGGGNGWNDGSNYGGQHQGRRHRKQRQNQPIGRVKRNDDGVILGIIGLAAGALITGAILNESSRNRKRQRQQQQHQRYVEPAPQRYRDYQPSPDQYDRDYGRSADQYDRDYYPPAPSEDYAAAGSIEPWTNEWYRYCSQRYRSFKPATGTFRGYDGQDHFCVAR